MSLFVDDPDFKLLVGDVRKCLRELPDESVHCVVTSPPYWGLRDYSVDGQLGLEPTPEAYVAAMVNVFREVRRVLRADGTCWLNLGDSYATRWGSIRDEGRAGLGDNSRRRTSTYEPRNTDLGRSEGDAGDARGAGSAEGGEPGLPARLGVHHREGAGVGGGGRLKEKDIVGIPWRVAFALQADGWYLRSDIVWSKPNPMPESVTDRPTKAHEMVFLLTKGPWKGREEGPIESRLDDDDARWLALLIDAEGNICVKRVAPQGDKAPQYAAQIAIGSTSRALLERAQEIVGAGSINERKGTNATMFYWQVSNKVAQDLLYAVYPHLIVKPRQARIAIHLESLLYHRGTQNGKRRTDAENAALESLWLRNKECNQFGEPDLSDVPLPKYGRWSETRYFFDQEAVREKYEGDLEYRAGRVGAYQNRAMNGIGDGTTPTSVRGPDGRRKTTVKGADGSIQHRDGERWPNGGRNVRSVWEIATQPYAEAHFATFPEALVERCVKAGTSERGCCPKCGAPWERTTEVEYVKSPVHGAGSVVGRHYETGANNYDGAGMPRLNKVTQTTGWSPTCDHDAAPIPATVCDPFMGSGTTALVARRLGRRSIGIELNGEYAALAAKRLQQLSLFAGEAS